MRNITIFDTTLRDGEQSPGASMNLPEKLEIAQALVDLRRRRHRGRLPDRLAGRLRGGPRRSPKRSRGVTICGLARCNDEDIDRAWEALKHAEQPRIHVFLATSAIHREFKLQDGQGGDHPAGGRGRHGAPSGTATTSSSRPRTRPAPSSTSSAEVVEAAIDAGATTVNIPDTVGYATPHADGRRDRARCASACPNIDQAVISVHCHNDLGLAVANTLAAVEAGAGQIECTINGIGERAGNCSLEEIVMALRTRSDFYGAETRIDTPATGADQPAGLRHHRHAGAAQQGDRRPQRLRPRGGHPPGRDAQGADAPTRSCGPRTSAFTKTDLVLGKHSGRAALADRAEALGYRLTGEQLKTSSRSSRSWPTRRRRSTTATSRP